jgi:peptide/nickel transport system permease protein
VSTVELNPDVRAGLPKPRLTRAKGILAQSPTLTIGLAIIGLIIIASAAAGFVSPYGAIAQDTAHALEGPSIRHWLGTDQLGRDVATRLLYAARLDLRIAITAVALSFASGVGLGCLAGYYSGWCDAVIMRLVDVVMAFPFFVLVIAMVFAIGPGERSIYVAIPIVGWVSYARLVRGQLLVLRNLDFVLAARIGGLRSPRIILRHILPNVLPQAVVFAMSDIVGAIGAIVALGYVGLGIPAPSAEWGSMIYDGQQFLTTHWQLSTIPGMAVVITAIGLSLIGDGLADLLRVES